MVQRFKDFAVENDAVDSDEMGYFAYRSKRRRNGAIDEGKDYFQKPHPAHPIRKDLGKHGSHVVGIAGSDKGIAVKFDRPKDEKDLHRQMSKHFKSVTKVKTDGHENVYHFNEGSVKVIAKTNSARYKKGQVIKNFDKKDITKAQAFQTTFNSRHGIETDLIQEDLDEAVAVDRDHRGKPITMQDIRLVAGEGKLSQKTIKQAIEVVKKDRKRLVGKAFKEEVEVDEALNLAQRRKRSIAFRKNKSKIRIGQQRARKRMADKGRLQKRARKAARQLILKKLTKGKSKSELDYARREAIEKRLDRMKGKIDVMARKLYPQIRKMERERKTKSNR